MNMDHGNDSGTGLESLASHSIDGKPPSLVDDAMMARLSPLLEQAALGLSRIRLTGTGPTPWGIDDAIAVILATSPIVHELMDTKLSKHDDNGELPVSLAHPASETLDGLQDVLQDLKNGKVDHRLLPRRGVRKHGHVLNKRKNEYLAAVDALTQKYRSAGEDSSQKRVVAEVAYALNLLGHRWPEGRSGDRQITATLLASWMKRRTR